MNMRWKLLFCLFGLFLFINNPLISMDPEIKSQWSQNLNFMFNGKVVMNQFDQPSSDNTIWHLEQAHTLFNAYEKCQHPPRRNVMRARINIIYSIGNEIKMVSLAKKQIYISGYDINDIELIPYQNTILGSELSFVSFNNVCGNLDQYGSQISLYKISGFIPNYYDDKIRDFQSSIYCHTERVFFYQIKNEIELILKSFKNTLERIDVKTTDVTVKGIVLDIASKNDMCNDCIEISTHEMKNKNFLENDFKHNLSKESIKHDDNFSCSILFSGITPLRGKSRTNNITKSKKDGNIEISSASNKLYFMASPYTTSHKDFVGFIKFDATSGWPEYKQ